MNILLVGDIFGKGGRKVVRYVLPRVVDREAVDLTIANVENATRGLGVSRDAVVELRKAGVQVMTSGNHIWKRPGVEELLESEPFLIRPANYPPNVPGKGSVVWESNTGVKLGVLNLMGRVFMEPLECPFRVGEEHVNRLSEEGVHLVVLDFHAEATSEKLALAWFLDGRVSAIVGTHTHVQTADERVLPNGTGYITDAGMTGPQDSVIGVKIQRSVDSFLTGVPQRLEPSLKNLVLNGVLISVSEETGRCEGIRRIAESLDRTES
jgi:metallophosphoesterase (TIGR00282 family)